MVTVLASELGVDETTARRVLAVARTIAPIDTVTDSDARADIVATLTGVAREALSRGQRNVTAQRIGPASVNYSTATSWFTDDDRTALRAACGLLPTRGGPVGSFPAPARVISHLWPERYDT